MPAVSYKNLIFDLGGVILDLSVAQTLSAFTTLSNLPQQEVQRIFTSSPEFEQYERGEMSDQEFRTFVKTAYSVSATDAEIDACWNAMLIGLPVKKLELLTDLKKRFQVLLLSNTNGIHLNFINDHILPKVSDEKDLDAFFHKAYYSHRMGKRKPDVAIFQQVLDENNLIAEETLFLDDNALNIEGAKAAGLQTFYVTSPEVVYNVFQ